MEWKNWQCRGGKIFVDNVGDQWEGRKFKICERRMERKCWQCRGGEEQIDNVEAQLEGRKFNIWGNISIFVEKYFNIWFVYLFKMMKGRIWWGEVPGAGLCQICVSAPPVERKHRRNIIALNGPTPIYFFSLKYFTSLAKLFGPNICGYVPVKRT